MLGLEPALQNLETHIQSETPKNKPNVKKVNKTEIVSLRKSGDSDSDSSSTISSNEDASIVRFNSSVFLRRISTDDGGGSGANLFEIFGSKTSDIRRNTIFESFELNADSPDVSGNGLVLVNESFEGLSKVR